MKNVTFIAMLLAVVGALNQGLVGLGGFLGNDLNVVSMLLGTWPIVENIVYLLVGVSGILVGYHHITEECHK